MKRYGNRSGHSGVAFFEDGPDFIKIQFVGSAKEVYVYDHVIPGAADVTRMKALAVAGRGLSAYIRQRVGKRYRRIELRGS
jgi:hypothetical protein